MKRSKNKKFHYTTMFNEQMLNIITLLSKLSGLSCKKVSCIATNDFYVLRKVKTGGYFTLLIVDRILHVTSYVWPKCYEWNDYIPLQRPPFSSPLDLYDWNVTVADVIKLRKVIKNNISAGTYDKLYFKRFKKLNHSKEQQLIQLTQQLTQQLAELVKSNHIPVEKPSFTSSWPGNQQHHQF